MTAQLRTDLDRILIGWLPGQRWFAGRDRTIAEVSTEVEPLRDDDPQIWISIVTVRYEGGSSEAYFVPISLHRSLDDQLRHALIGEVSDGQWAHDALLDRDTTSLWTDLLADASDLGWVHFTREPGALIPTGRAGDIMMAEQSNSSLVYGDEAIVKFFRRLENGVNPDVEVHQALGPLRNEHIAPLLGSATIQRGDLTATIAMAQTYLPVASDGWALATTSVRDLFAEGDLHPDEVGGDFAAEAHRLGAATASVHADLRRVLPVSEADPAWLSAKAAAMVQRLVDAIDVVPQLVDHRKGLLAAYEQLPDIASGLPLQRVHGDFHLGQVLRTAATWTILDFEGEPRWSIADRRTLDTPLRDIAGMLRSFEYASRSLLLGEAERAAIVSQLAYRAGEWADRNRAAYCAGYAEVAGTDPREFGDVLRAYEADKAVYEAVYEARHRPAWIDVPLQSLRRFADDGGAP